MLVKNVIMKQHYKPMVKINGKEIIKERIEELKDNQYDYEICSSQYIINENKIEKLKELLELFED